MRAQPALARLTRCLRPPRSRWRAAQVEEPSKYGVVQHDPSGRVLRFVNKPKQYSGNLVASGVAVFSPSVLSRLQPKPASMEKEILPLMAQEGELYCLPLPGYWLDIGSPKNHLLGAQMRLKHLRNTDPSSLSTHPSVIGDCLIAESAQIGKGCEIGPGVVIGPNVVVHDGARASRRAVRTSAAVRRAPRALRAPPPCACRRPPAGLIRLARPRRACAAQACTWSVARCSRAA